MPLDALQQLREAFAPPKADDPPAEDPPPVAADAPWRDWPADATLEYGVLFPEANKC